MIKNDNHDQKKFNGTIEGVDRILQKVVERIEERLWSNKDGCYMDLQEYETHIGGPYRTITQDVVLYLIANFDRIREQGVHTDKRKIDSNESLDLYSRAISTLNVIKERIWKKGKWLLVTEVA
jgi:hypothetical protein